MQKTKKKKTLKYKSQADTTGKKDYFYQFTTTD